MPSYGWTLGDVWRHDGYYNKGPEKVAVGIQQIETIHTAKHTIKIGKIILPPKKMSLQSRFREPA